MKIGKYLIELTSDFNWLPWERVEVSYDDNGIGTTYIYKGWLCFVVSQTICYYEQCD